MAIALVNDDATNSIPRAINNADQTDYACNAGGPSNNGLYTPTANSLLLCLFATNGSLDPDGSPPVSGHGVTYSKKQVLATTNLGCVGIYAALAGGSPTNAALTCKWATGRTHCDIYDLCFTGVDLAGGALAAIVQVPSVGNSVGSSSVTVNLAAAGASGNRAVACCSISGNEAITEDSNYPEIHDEGHSAPNRRFSVSFNSSGFDTEIVHSWSTSTLLSRAFGIELKAAEVPPSGLAWELGWAPL